MKTKKTILISACLLAAFALWTVLIMHIDVRPIGPQNSSVGFAALNGFVHDLTGAHLTLYVITDWLGLVPLAFVAGFGIFGLVQWIKRKHLLSVDYDILILGLFYIIVMAVYILFETIVINYRPVLINGFLESSYPSSTTLLVMSVIPTVIMQFNARISSRLFKAFINIFLYIFIIFMVIGRLISGVHWFTDIAGAALLSAGLVMLYKSVISSAYRFHSQSK